MNIKWRFPLRFYSLTNSTPLETNFFELKKSKKWNWEKFLDFSSWPTPIWLDGIEESTITRDLAQRERRNLATCVINWWFRQRTILKNWKKWWNWWKQEEKEALPIKPKWIKPNSIDSETFINNLDLNQGSPEPHQDYRPAWRSDH